MNYLTLKIKGQMVNTYLSTLVNTWINFQIIKKFNLVQEELTPYQLAAVIKRGRLSNNDFRESVMKIRSPEVNTVEKNKLTNTIPSFMPSAKVKKLRREENIVGITGVVCLHTVEVTDAELNNLREKLETANRNNARGLLMAFVSPDGKTYTLLIRVNYKKEQHKDAFAFVANYYDDLLGVKCNRLDQNLVSLCFVSYDENVVLKENPIAIEFKYDERADEIEKTYSSRASEIFNDLFTRAIEITNERSRAKLGNTNSHIHLLATNCNKAGIPMQFAVIRIIKKYCRPNDVERAKKIESIIKDAYKDSGELEPFEKEESFYFTERVYAMFPTILKQAACLLKEKREREIFVMSCLVFLSGCFPQVKGRYGMENVFCNLYLIIIARAATGKGMARVAKRLVDEIDNYIRDKISAESISNDTEAISSKNKKDDSSNITESKLKSLFIPANNSVASFIKNLADNGEQGILFTEEADIVGANFAQEWGDSGGVFRLGFHHSSIDSSRVKDDQRLHLKEPKISILLLGTPNQLRGIIDNVENGLFSRFLFYEFISELEWKSQKPTDGSNMFLDTVKKSSHELLAIYKRLENKEITFHMSDKQWNAMDAYFKPLLEKETNELEGYAASVKRLGLILFKIAMIMSVISIEENHKIPDVLECTEDNFYLALEIVQHLESHTRKVFSDLKQQSKLGVNKGYGVDQESLFKGLVDLLPKEFKTNEFKRIMALSGYGVRKVEQELRNGLGIKWEKITHGSYRKL